MSKIYEFYLLDWNVYLSKFFFAFCFNFIKEFYFQVKFTNEIKKTLLTACTFSRGIDCVENIIATGNLKMIFNFFFYKNILKSQTLNMK